MTPAEALALNWFGRLLFGALQRFGVRRGHELKVLTEMRDLMLEERDERRAERRRQLFAEPQRFYCLGRLASGGKRVEITFVTKGGPRVQDASVNIHDMAGGTQWGPFRCEPRLMPSKGQGRASWNDPPQTRWPQFGGNLTWVSQGMRWRAPLLVGDIATGQMFSTDLEAAVEVEHVDEP